MLCSCRISIFCGYQKLISRRYKIFFYRLGYIKLKSDIIYNIKQQYEAGVTDKNSCV